MFGRVASLREGPYFLKTIFQLVVTVAVIHSLWTLAAAPPVLFAIIVQEESSKETRFSRKCAIYFPTYDKSDEMEDVQNELRRKYEIVFKPAVLWPNINFSLRTFTAFVGVLAKKKFANLHERNRTQMHA